MTRTQGRSLTPLVCLSVRLCARARVCVCVYRHNLCVYVGFLKNFNLCEWFTSFFGETPSAAQNEKPGRSMSVDFFFWRGGGW